MRNYQLMITLLFFLGFLCVSGKREVIEPPFASWEAERYMCADLSICTVASPQVCRVNLAKVCSKY